MLFFALKNGWAHAGVFSHQTQDTTKRSKTQRNRTLERELFFVCFTYVNNDNGWGHPSQSVSHRASHAVSNLGPFSRLLSHPASRLTANQPSANQLPSQPASSTSHPASQQPSSQLVIQLASEAQPSQTGSQALPNQTVSQSQPAAKMPRRDPKRTPKTSPNHAQKHATF